MIGGRSRSSIQVVMIFAFTGAWHKIVSDNYFYVSITINGFYYGIFIILVIPTVLKSHKIIVCVCVYARAHVGT